MYTFVFIANVDNESPDITLDSCARIVKKWMPSLGVKLVENRRILPELNCGWFWLAPPQETSHPLISEAIEDRYAVLVFGDVAERDRNSAAQTILNTWASNGATGVRSLEGCFSAIVLDRIDGTVTAIGDPIGQRSLRYYADSRTLIVSPHDIPIVATGRCPVEFDLVSACSIAAVGWSLKGKSLLDRVQTCHPAEYIRWDKGRIQRFSMPILDRDRRIDVGNPQAIADNLDQIIETTRTHIKARVGSMPEIRMTLSAGLDSRAVLSLLLSVVTPSQINASTTGEPDSLDVRVARQLAKIYGIRWSSSLGNPQAVNSDDFIAHCDLLAFSLNGDVSLKDVAIKPLPKLEPNLSPMLHGDGGEIFRGFFYHLKNVSSRSHLSPSDALLIVKNWTRMSGLSSLWQYPDLTNAVLARLTDIIDEYTEFSPDGCDILDLFYLYERTAVWGARKQRETWYPHVWRPFYIQQAIELAYLMPAPIADYAQIHQAALRRFTPRAYWMRVNGETLLPLEDERLIAARLLQKVDRTYRDVLHRTQRILSRTRSKNQSKGIEQLRAEVLTGPLQKTVLDILMSEGSLAIELFGKQGVESIVNKRTVPLLVRADLLGCLIAIDRWHTMVRAVAKEASQNLSRVRLRE